MPKEFLNFLSCKRVRTIFLWGFTVAIFLFLWENMLIPHNCHHLFMDDTTSAITSAEVEATSLPFTPAAFSSMEQNNTFQKPVYHIHVNLDTKQLYVYKDGTLIKTYPCSGGKALTPSPEGTWKIISKDTWGEGFGGSWLGFNVPWGKYGIHGTDQPWFIGRANESQGCIRMLNKDVAELYKMIPHGTTVSIVQTHKTFRVMRDGDIGSDVRDLQMALHRLGYYHGGMDGRYGRLLTTGVQKFQRDNKLKPTGNTDQRTFELIAQKVKTLEQETSE